VNLNPSKEFRAVLYVVTMVGGPVVAYLNAKGYIGSLEVALWSAETTIVAGLAAFNTGTIPPPAPDPQSD